MTEHRGETFVMSDEPAGPISFSTFILGLASTTLIHLGAAPNPETGLQAPQRDLALQSLALLDVLREKTKGNLSADEDQLFASVLTDLRLKFVQLSRP